MKLYTDLEVWIESRKLVNKVYLLTKEFPESENFGITNQIRRCAVSIPSNIAEGCGRSSTKDTIRFLHIASGSLYEFETQLYLSLDQEYIKENKFRNIMKRVTSCNKLLNGFINYYKKLR